MQCFLKELGKEETTEHALKWAAFQTSQFLLWNSRARSWGGVSRKSVAGIDLKLVCASGDKGVRRAKGRLELMTHRTRRWEAAAVRVAQTIKGSKN